MFVGFIAVIIILLIIVGLMSTGGTNASGGINQTKAVKAVSEISTIAQSTGYYKTSNTSNYDKLSLVGLETLGILDHTDLVEANGDGVDYAGKGGTFIDNAGAVADNTLLIRSKSVEGLYYTIQANADITKFDFNLVVDTTVIADGSTLAKALDSSMLKFTNAVSLASSSPTDGAAVITFK